MKGKDIFVVAHRGFSGKYPENTILSFQKAVELGADFIELDVHETKDGELIVMHDDKVDRTTDGKGYIRDLEYKEISGFDAGRWKGFENVGVPSLDEVFRILEGKIKLFIEVKKASPKKVVELARKYGMERNIVIGSFNLDYVVETRKIAPAVSTALITSDFPANADVLVENGIPLVTMEYHRFHGRRAREFLARGISFGVWTVDDEDDLKKMVEKRIHFITTNRPDILKKILQSAV